MKYLLYLLFLIWLVCAAVVALCIDCARFICTKFTFVQTLAMFAALSGAYAQQADTLNVLQYTGPLDTLRGSIMVMGKEISPGRHNVYLIEGYALEWKVAPLSGKIEYYTRRHVKIPRERVLSFVVNKALVNQN
jgi:hypothetical protein